MVFVKYEDLTEAFDFVSFGGPLEHSAYISLDTGTIYWDTDSGKEDLPDVHGESNRYAAVPHKNDLDLGRHLVLCFVTSELPDQYARLEGFFHHRGAYARLKELLGSEGCLEAWYPFEAAETSTALRNWCRENDMQIVGDRGESPA